MPAFCKILYSAIFCEGSEDIGGEKDVKKQGRQDLSVLGCDKPQLREQKANGGKEKEDRDLREDDQHNITSKKIEDQGKRTENDRLMGNIEPERMTPAEIEDRDIPSAEIVEKSIFFKNAVKEKSDEKEEYPRKKRKIVARCKE